MLAMSALASGPLDCTETFSDSASLVRHQLAHRKTYACRECNYASTNRSDLEKHGRKHSGEQPYACELCEKKFSDRSNFRRHVRARHPGPALPLSADGDNLPASGVADPPIAGVRPHVCPECGKGFMRVSGLTLHRRTHQAAAIRPSEVRGGQDASSRTFLTALASTDGTAPDDIRAAAASSVGTSYPI